MSGISLDTGQPDVPGTSDTIAPIPMLSSHQKFTHALAFTTTSGLKTSPSVY